VPPLTAAGGIAHDAGGLPQVVTLPFSAVHGSDDVIGTVRDNREARRTRQVRHPAGELIDDPELRQHALRHTRGEPVPNDLPNRTSFPVVCPSDVATTHFSGYRDTQTSAESTNGPPKPALTKSGPFGAAA